MNKLTELIYIDLLNIVDEETLIAIIQMYINDIPVQIKFIENPSEIVQLEAIKSSMTSLKYIKNPSEKVQLAAVRLNGYLIDYIKKPSEEVQLAAIKQDSFSIQNIKKPSELAQLEAVKNINDYFFFMDNYFHKINYSKALNYIYKQAPNQYKEQIKSHKNYISDAQLVLESIK